MDSIARIPRVFCEGKQEEPPWRLFSISSSRTSDATAADADADADAADPDADVAAADPDAHAAYEDGGSVNAGHNKSGNRQPRPTRPASLYNTCPERPSWPTRGRTPPSTSRRKTSLHAVIQRKHKLFILLGLKYVYSCFNRVDVHL